MRDDRWPRKQVVVDEDANAEEMEVVLSIREVRDVAPHIDFTQNVERLEPWLRIRDGVGLEVSFGIEVVYREEDGA